MNQQVRPPRAGKIRDSGTQDERAWIAVNNWSESNSLPEKRVQDKPLAGFGPGVGMGAFKMSAPVRECMGQLTYDAGGTPFS
jgi:hypothetical protein